MNKTPESYFIECLEELFDTPATNVKFIDDNKCEVFLDGVGTFELDIKCIEDLRGK